MKNDIEYLKQTTVRTINLKIKDDENSRKIGEIIDEMPSDLNNILRTLLTFRNKPYELDDKLITKDDTTEELRKFYDINNNNDKFKDVYPDFNSFQVDCSLFYKNLIYQNPNKEDKEYNISRGAANILFNDDKITLSPTSTLVYNGITLKKSEIKLLEKYKTKDIDDKIRQINDKKMDSDYQIKHNDSMNIQNRLLSIKKELQERYNKNIIKDEKDKGKKKQLMADKKQLNDQLNDQEKQLKNIKRKNKSIPENKTINDDIKIILDNEEIQRIRKKCNDDSIKNILTQQKTDVISKFQYAGIIPFKIKDYGCVETKYVLAESIFKKITSFESIQADYLTQMNDFNREIENNENKEILLLCAEFFDEAQKIGQLNKSKNFWVFRNNFKYTVDKTKKCYDIFNNIVSNKIFIEYPQNFYDLCRMEKYNDIWKYLSDTENEKFIGETYGWKKESVGISTFKMGELLCTMDYQGSQNYIKAKMNIVDFGYNVLLYIQKDKPITLELLSSKQFKNPKFIFNETTKKTTIQWFQDTKNKTMYTATLKEIKIRRSVKHKALMLDLNLNIENNKSKEKIDIINYHIVKQSSAYMGKDQPVKKDINGKIVVVGIDLNNNSQNSWVGASYEATYENGNIKDTKFIETFQSIISKNSTQLTGIKDLIDRCETNIRLQRNSKIYLKNIKENSDQSETIKEIRKDLIDSDSYIQFLNEYYEYNKSKELREIYRVLQNKKTNWLVGNEHFQILKDIQKIKNYYFNLPLDEKKEYTTYNNKADYINILKKELYQTEERMKRTWQCFAGKQLSIEDYKPNKNVSGITNFYIKTLASDIVNACRDKNCDVIHLENLDHFTTKQDTKRDNNLKRLLSWGKLMDEIKKIANKHGIAILKINHAYTSQINPDTEEIGCESTEESRKIKFTDGSIFDRDEIASKNIAIRGLTQNKLVPNIPIYETKIDDQTYYVPRVDKQKIGKIKRGALIYRVEQLSSTGKNNYDQIIKQLKSGEWKKNNIILKEENNKLILVNDNDIIEKQKIEYNINNKRLLLFNKKEWILAGL